MISGSDEKCAVLIKSSLTITVVLGSDEIQIHYCLKNKPSRKQEKFSDVNREVPETKPISQLPLSPSPNNIYC